MNHLFSLFLLSILIFLNHQKAPAQSEQFKAPKHYTYTLKQSVKGLKIWTTPCTRKVRTKYKAPKRKKSGIFISAAKREFEPFQIILGRGSGQVRVKMKPFKKLGSKQRIRLAVAEYKSGWAEYLRPIKAGSRISLKSNQSTPLWITVFVPPDAPAGLHKTTLILKYQDNTIKIPVKLYVFDFALPKKINYASQFNVSIRKLIPKGGTVDDAKTLLFEHRLTPKSVTWPSGFHPKITWENKRNPKRCRSFYDEPDEGKQYSIRYLAKRYIHGKGWNGVGFPNAMIFQFVNNNTPRPDKFCGISRGDHYGSKQYNAKWSRFLKKLSKYLKKHGYINKAYYYVMNEPQNDKDHRLAAHLARIIKKAAPDLRIAISEEPKPEIAEHPDGHCSYDIWIAHIRSYQQDYAWKRQRDFDETLWFYSLDHDPDPYFNPSRVDKQGMHQRIIPWVSWRYRVCGWAYYAGNRFFNLYGPTIRAELLREGFEDYEYLYLANGNAHPKVFSNNKIDKTVYSVAGSLTSWNKNAGALMRLRFKLGQYIEGSRKSPPVLRIKTKTRPKKAYYINFQDPKAQPTDNPLIVKGKTYMKIGWLSYSKKKNYGWYGEKINNSKIARYGYDRVNGYNELEKSYV